MHFYHNQTTLPMIFYMFFQKNINKNIIVELKNGLVISGKLLSCDIFLNIKLCDVTVKDLENYRGLSGVSTLSVRGSCVKYVKLEKDEDLIASLLETTRNRFIVNEIREEAEKESDSQMV
ncbi:putative snRNP core protein [Trachipleistophora hominis]|uniref:Putative snRNP core protein n=1 Tax=Trachipleistophora hominis TaxID=72359 RepID=L7JYM1_TRAHO|nr:putative snRNP core protein [Trachipleistophora hominis]